MREVLKEYCTGCGLCKAECAVDFYPDQKGFMTPQIDKEEQISFCKNVCFSAGKPTKMFSSDKVWGKSEAVFLGWSADENIRIKASSGGVLTSVCCYLLESGQVDGIIQTIKDDKIPYKTKTVISRSIEQVKACMGSRYSVSAPLENIKEYLENDGVFAFVGKPCDVAILRTYIENHKEYEGKIRYMLSFFCAGQPSTNAQIKLLKQLGCDSEAECVSLQYRGNGWPGYATAVKDDGSEKTMSYNDSWGKILGRDVRKCCRLCLDGIGELADIACGDAWYLSSDGKPDFSEGKGRNVVFARNKVGNTLLKEAVQNGYLVLEDYDNYEIELKKIQRYQYDRRVTMLAMITALRFRRRMIPNYDLDVLRGLARKATFKQKAKRFLGTIKRIKQGKL